VNLIGAQQVRFYIIYKNTKLKLMKTNAAIWFNMICQEVHLQPKYISFRINGHKQKGRKTATNAIRLRINQEVKFLYKKKHFNQQLYGSQPECANYYNVCGSICKQLYRVGHKSLTTLCKSQNMRNKWTTTICDLIRSRGSH
jgi:hypothetical protein